ncbi:MAG: hypothetical protein E2590_12695 [Chryseobacterium sp.]|nr:hypothetical protein [Chryseobacterium sp.]
MKQYPSNRVLKKKLSKLQIFSDNSFVPREYGHVWTSFSEDVKEIIEKAVDITSNLSKDEEVSRYTSFIQLGNDDIGFDDVGKEYDTCDNDDCIEQSIIDAKENYPDQEVSSCLYANDGDHDNVERCYVCEKPLNEWLTWVEYESEYFTSDNRIWEKSLIRNNAFYLAAIFRSIPSCDVTYDSKRDHFYSLTEYKYDCYEFYTPLIKLAIYINQNFR